MPLNIIQQDITKVKVDAIVNAANKNLKMGGGICGAIFEAAGVEELQAACEKLSPIRTGEAVITPGFNLPAKYIIHTVGPVYEAWNKARSAELLAAAYTNSLIKAVENNAESVAFPLISAGAFGYPKEEAMQVATEAIKNFLEDHDLDVFLVLFDKSVLSISKKLQRAVEKYIRQNFADSSWARRADVYDSGPVYAPRMSAKTVYLEDKSVAREADLIEDVIGDLDEPFADMLMRLIDAKGMLDVEVYKRANLSRKLFSKIRSTKNYMPSKRTAIALAIALELTLEETDALLERAGFALSSAVIFDVIVEYFIENAIYDIYAINEMLFKYDQPLLGG